MTAAALLATERWCRRVLLPKGVAFVSSCGIVAAQLALVTFEHSSPPLPPAAPDIVVSLVSPDLVMPPPVPLRPAPLRASKAQRDPRPTEEPKPAKLARPETAAAAAMAPAQASAPPFDDRAPPAVTPAAFAPHAPAPAAAKSPPSAEDAALRAYQEQVWRMIMARRPPGARLTGGAMVSFHLMADGAPCDIEIVRTSGDPMLDRLAVHTVRRAGPFPKPPAGVDASTRFQIWFRIR